MDITVHIPNNIGEKLQRLGLNPQDLLQHFINSEGVEYLEEVIEDESTDEGDEDNLGREESYLQNEERIHLVPNNNIPSSHWGKHKQHLTT